MNNIMKKYILFTALLSAALLLPFQMPAAASDFPDDPPEKKAVDTNAGPLGYTIEDADRVMAELVSKLPKEQREKIRKSNGEMYEYIPPASLQKKKVKRRRVLEIVPSEDLASVGREEDFPVEYYRVYKKKGDGASSAEDAELVKNVFNIIDAQNGQYSDSYGNSKNFMDHFSIAVGVSTTGLRLDYGSTISPNVDFRLGFSFLDYDLDFTTGLNDDLIRGAVAGGYNPDLDVKADMKFYNLHALFDFYPMRNGIFYLSGGLFFGKNTIKVKGSLVDPETGDAASLDPAVGQWPSLHFADYEIPIQADGTMQVDIRTGKNWVKPYLGLGLGRSVPKGNFSIKFEAGLMYQGSYQMEYNGTELKKASGRSDSFDNGNYKKLMKWWPVVNLQLVYRFK